jgi:hypothetical protein
MKRDREKRIWYESSTELVEEWRWGGDVKMRAETELK